MSSEFEHGIEAVASLILNSGDAQLELYYMRALGCKGYAKQFMEKMKEKEYRQLVSVEYIHGVDAVKPTIAGTSRTAIIENVVRAAGYLVDENESPESDQSWQERMHSLEFEVKTLRAYEKVHNQEKS